MDNVNPANILVKLVKILPIRISVIAVGMTHKEEIYITITVVAKTDTMNNHLKKFAYPVFLPVLNVLQPMFVQYMTVRILFQACTITLPQKNVKIVNTHVRLVHH